MRLLTKPSFALASLVISVVLAGSAYAIAIEWPKTLVKLSGEQQLPGGNRVVAIDTESCEYTKAVDGSVIFQNEGKTVYYEIRQDSPLTNNDVVEMLQSHCQEDAVSYALNTVVKQRFGEIKKGETGPNIMSGSGFVVSAVHDDAVTVRWHESTGSENMNTDFTYKLEADALVLDKNVPITIGDLLPGDHVTLLVRDHHNLGSEVDPNDPNHWDDTNLITVEAILRRPASIRLADFYNKLGIEFVRTEPCELPAGFCRAYEFQEK